MNRMTKNQGTIDPTVARHLMTRVSVMAILASFAAACGDAGDMSEETSEAASGLVGIGTTTLPPTRLPIQKSPITLNPAPIVVSQPPVSGPIPADASAPIACATVDQNVTLPDGTSASLAQDNTWFDGIVSFRFHSSVVPGGAAQTAILDAIRHYNFMTAVRWVFDANSNQTDHVLFRTDGVDCVSRGIGYKGGTHEVNLFSPPSGATCATFDVAVHELGHRVGLHHEQRRADRDKFILIQDNKVHDGVKTNDNIQAERLGQFDIYQGPGYQVGGFDFDSVMLYPSITGDATFAKDTSKPIITRRDGSIYPNPQTGGLSAGDTSTLFQLYPPPALVANADNTCRTAPIKRSTLPTNTALFPRLTELLAVSDNAGTVAFSEYPSTLSSFGPPNSWGGSGGFGNHVPWAAGDFNKDGLTDIAEIESSAGMNRIVVRTANGSGLNLQRIWADRAGKFEHARQWLPGDYDKDGRDDLAVVWRDGSQTTISVFLSNGVFFSDVDHWAIQDSPWDWYARWTVGDFNNDGRADIASISNDEGLNTITVRLSTGSSFITQQWATRQGAFGYFTKWLAGDFTGDDLTDLVEIRKDGSNTVAQVYVSTGGAFSAPAQWLSFVDGTVPPLPPVQGTLVMDTSTGTFSTARQISTTTGGTTPPVVVVDPPEVDSSRWTAGDFNNDGRYDLASVTNHGGANVITVLQSTGSSFTSANWSRPSGSYLASTQWCAGRFRSPSPTVGELSR